MILKFTRKCKGSGTQETMLETMDKGEGLIFSNLIQKKRKNATGASFTPCRKINLKSIIDGNGRVKTVTLPGVNIGVNPQECKSAKFGNPLKS